MKSNIEQTHSKTVIDNYLKNRGSAYKYASDKFDVNFEEKTLESLILEDIQGNFILDVGGHYVACYLDKQEGKKPNLYVLNTLDSRPYSEIVRNNLNITKEEFAKLTKDDLANFNYRYETSFDENSFQALLNNRDNDLHLQERIRLAKPEKFDKIFVIDNVHENDIEGDTNNQNNCLVNSINNLKAMEEIAKMSKVTLDKNYIKKNLPKFYKSELVKKMNEVLALNDLSLALTAKQSNNDAILRNNMTQNPAFKIDTAGIEIKDIKEKINLLKSEIKDLRNNHYKVVKAEITKKETSQALVSYKSNGFQPQNTDDILNKTKERIKEQELLLKDLDDFPNSEDLQKLKQECKEELEKQKTLLEKLQNVKMDTFNKEQFNQLTKNYFEINSQDKCIIGNIQALLPANKQESKSLLNQKFTSNTFTPNGIKCNRENNESAQKLQKLIRV